MASRLRGGAQQAGMSTHAHLHRLTLPVKPEATAVPCAPQIAVETAASFQYLAMYAFFDRPEVALKQAAAFFEKAQTEEIGHAKAFIKYQNSRGGRVTLQRIQVPEQDAEHAHTCNSSAVCMRCTCHMHMHAVHMHMQCAGSSHALCMQCTC